MQQIFKIEKAHLLKAILPIGILLGHYIQKYIPIGENSFCDYFRYSGAYIVALFFFMSGYGLTYSVHTKSNYLNGLLKKRIIPLLIPLFIAIVLFQIYKLLLGEKSSYVDYIAIVSGDTNAFLPASWFVYALCIFYVLFNFSFKRTNIDKFSIAHLFILIFMYCIVLKIFNWGGWWIMSSFAFPFGVVFYFVEYRFSKKFFLLFFVACLSIFCLSFVFTIPNIELIRYMFFPIVSIIPLCYVSSLVSVNFSNKVVLWMSSVSYEFYLTHVIALRVFHNQYISINNTLIGLIYTIALSYILAEIVHEISSRIIKCMK